MLVSVPLSYRFSGIHVAKVQRSKETTKRIKHFFYFSTEKSFWVSDLVHRDAETQSIYSSALFIFLSQGWLSPYAYQEA